MAFGRLGALGRGFGSLGSSGGGGVVVPAAPALTWNSTSADTTPDFLVDLPSGNVDPIKDATAGDHLILEHQLQSGGAWTQYLDRTLSGGDISDDTISVTGVGALSSGDYYFRGRIERGALIGTNSSSVAVTVAANPPVNTVAPVISGNLQVGQTLTTTDGTWTGTATITFTYQWKRGGSNITSATNSTYVLVEADAGQAITCAVTGTNGIGNSTGTSNSLTIDVYVIYLTSIADGTDATTYSAGVWNTIGLGTAAANRKIVLGLISRGAANQTVSSASIGGQTATSFAHADSSTAGSAADIVVADVPTGTTGDISITWSGARTRCGTGVWAVYGAGSSTPSATATSAASPVSQSLAIPAKGVAIGCGLVQDNTATGVWANLTERYDSAVETARQTGADTTSAAGATPTITLTWTPGTLNLQAAALASWGP